MKVRLCELTPVLSSGLGCELVIKLVLDNYNLFSLFIFSPTLTMVNHGPVQSNTIVFFQSPSFSNFVAHCYFRVGIKIKNCVAHKVGTFP